MDERTKRRAGCDSHRMELAHLGTELVRWHRAGGMRAGRGRTERRGGAAHGRRSHGAWSSVTRRTPKGSNRCAMAGCGASTRGCPTTTVVPSRRSRSSVTPCAFSPPGKSHDARRVKVTCSAWTHRPPRCTGTGAQVPHPRQKSPRCGAVRERVLARRSQRRLHHDPQTPGTRDLAAFSRRFSHHRGDRRGCAALDRRLTWGSVLHGSCASGADAGNLCTKRRARSRPVRRASTHRGCPHRLRAIRIIS